MEKIEPFNYNKYLIKTKEKDNEAITKLYKELNRPIFILALSILNDYQMAEDVLNETFIKIMSNDSKCEKVTNAKAWIMTIAKNISLNLVKKRKREDLKDDFTLGDEKHFTEEVLSTMEFFELIKPLDEKEKEIVALRLSAGLSYKDISKIQNITVVAARKEYSRAIKKLKARNSRRDSYV